jgi:hypothetical protein
MDTKLNLVGVLNNKEVTHNVGTDNPPVLKTDTQETESLDKAISLDQEGTSTQAQNG